jgi:hypothetical protein
LSSALFAAVSPSASVAGASAGRGAVATRVRRTVFGGATGVVLALREGLAVSPGSGAAGIAGNAGAVVRGSGVGTAGRVGVVSDGRPVAVPAGSRRWLVSSAPRGAGGIAVGR